MSQKQKDATSELKPIPAKRAVLAVFAAWILTLGVDVFLHAGLLANLYAQPLPFLLDAQTAFYRIPIGYASFLILNVALYWLCHKLNVQGGKSGFQFGVAVGFVGWGAFLLGLFSISTISVPLFIAWLLGQSLELGLSGAVFGSVASGARFKKIWTIVVIVVITCFVITVLLQTIGWAPPMQAI